MPYVTFVRSIVFAALGMLCAGNASATLFDRGGGLIYDDVFDITWLQDADVSGQLTWPNARIWADNFTYFDTVRGVTWTDWRLPEISSTSPDATPRLCGDGDATECAAAGNELAYMFYVSLGGFPGSDKTGDQTAANGVLVNDIGTFDYWSATECPECGAWSLFFANGIQRHSGPGSLQGPNGFAWAVRDGDVAINSPIPEPDTYLLVLAGLGLLIFGSVRKPRPA